MWINNVSFKFSSIFVDILTDVLEKANGAIECQLNSMKMNRTRQILG